jgi:putative transcriptional regulator
MIKHHPKFELIQSFVNGDLPAALSAGIAIHIDMCPKCKKSVALLTEQVAEQSFEESFLDRFIVDENDSLDEIATINFDDMIADITDSADIDSVITPVTKTVEFNKKVYTLPNVLNNIGVGKPANIGNLSRARLQIEDNEVHSSLLHIQPGGGVPQHTHKGFELTVLLDGSFHDEDGEYVKGDFIMVEGSHKHHPISTNGCLCYTVANGALHFTQGINKLLNPIGTFIY